MLYLVEAVREFLALPMVIASVPAFCTGVLAFVAIAAVVDLHAPDGVNQRMIRALIYCGVVALIYEYLMFPAIKVPVLLRGTFGEPILIALLSIICAVLAFAVGFVVAGIVMLVRWLVLSTWQWTMIHFYGWFDKRRPKYVEKPSRSH